MKHIIVQARDKSVRSMRARAMESISFIGLSMGKEVFREDAKEIMGMFLEIMSEWMMMLWDHVCVIMYGSHVMSCDVMSTMR